VFREVNARSGACDISNVMGEAGVDGMERKGMSERILLFIIIKPNYSTRSTATCNLMGTIFVHCEVKIKLIAITCEIT
jgi:hypothetical protein